MMVLADVVQKLLDGGEKNEKRRKYSSSRLNVMKCIFLSFFSFVTKATYSCLGRVN